MNNTITILLVIILGMNYSCTQETPKNNSLENAKKEAEAQPAIHLLDGTSMDYHYSDGGAIHMEIYKGMLKYEWIEGTRKGNGNKDLIYTSRKIGDKMYLVSWLEASHPDYTSLIFDFNNKRMYSTGIFRFGSENQFIRFDKGAIGEFELVEK